MNKREVSTLIPYRKEGNNLYLFLQKRDKNAQRSPDWWGFFGGGLEAGEIPEQAMLREIKEELNIEPRGYQFLKRYESDHSINHVFIIKERDDFEAKIQINEGQYGRFLKLEDALAEPKLSDTDKAAIKDLSSLVLQSQKITPLIFPSYLAMIRNSVRSNMFRNLYAEVDGEKKEVMKDGDLSCAFFVSSILTLFRLIERVHGTVDGTIKDLEKSGWVKIEELREGSVLVWEGKIDQSGENHKHIGFYISNDQAVSNSSEKKSPDIHHFTYGEVGSPTYRKITAIYWKDLER